jgi:hypothetical protein
MHRAATTEVGAAQLELTLKVPETLAEFEGDKPPTVEAPSVRVPLAVALVGPLADSVIEKETEALPPAT